MVESTLAAYRHSQHTGSAPSVNLGMVGGSCAVVVVSRRRDRRSDRTVCRIVGAARLHVDGRAVRGEIVGQRRPHLEHLEHLSLLTLYERSEQH